jgi:acyl-CoA reductase-like NAD-dependent aldehyde dehydrogenase
VAVFLDWRGGAVGFQTVLAQTKRHMRVVREEIFGPVLCVQSFDDDDLDAVAAIANDTEYCLQASVWTRNLSVAHRMARKIEACTICINTHNYGDPAWPFGGYKHSGWGREMGKDVMEHYTETKSVAAKLWQLCCRYGCASEGDVLGRVRITAKLILAIDQTNLWAQDYD